MPAGAPPAAVPSTSGRPLSLPGWEDTGRLERERLIARARQTDATRQLQRCFPHWSRALEHLAWRALVRLAANEPVDPNDPDMWTSRDEQPLGVLRRHGLTNTNVGRLTLAAVRSLIDGQATVDGDTAAVPALGSRSTPEPTGETRLTRLGAVWRSLRILVLGSAASPGSRQRSPSSASPDARRVLMSTSAPDRAEINHLS